MPKPWYITLSIVSCGIILVAVLGLLSLNAFFVSDNGEEKDKILCLGRNQKWKEHNVASLPMTLAFAAVYIFGIWVIIQPKRKSAFMILLFLNAICISIATYFSVVYYLEIDKPKDMDANSLFGRTRNLISEQMTKSKKNWLPDWLDRVQKESKTCCGIRSFRDWEELWPMSETEVPKSCCKSMDCETDMSLIEFPGTASKVIKTDKGCIDDLKHSCLKNVYHSAIYTFVVCMLMLVAEIIFVIQFVIQYIKGDIIESNGNGEIPLVPDSDGLAGDFLIIPSDPQDDNKGLPIQTRSRFQAFTDWFTKLKRSKDKDNNTADKDDNKKTNNDQGVSSGLPGDSLYDTKVARSGSFPNYASAGGSTTLTSLQSQGTLPSPTPSPNPNTFSYGLARQYSGSQLPIESLQNMQQQPQQGRQAQQQAMSSALNGPIQMQNMQQQYTQGNSLSGTVTATSSTTDIVNDLPRPPNQRKKKKSWSKQDDQTGNSGIADIVPTQQVFMVQDTSNNLPNDNYDYGGAASSIGRSPRMASPSASTDEVGDKLAPGMKPNRDPKVFGPGAYRKR